LAVEIYKSNTNFQMIHKMKTKWNIDQAHSEIGFRAKYMVISTVTGHFESFKATIESETEDFSHSQINFTAQTNSITTKNSKRDDHLKADNFFNAKAYPELVFTSKSFISNMLIGDLTIRGITKEISLDVDFRGVTIDLKEQTKASFEVKGTISRKEFNLTWNALIEAGNIVVSDTIKLIIDLQFIKE
jgi:polyisoprenoid-binding protein YceI